MTKSAVLYDFLLESGGAESVTFALSSILDQAEIYTDFNLQDKASNQLDGQINELGRPLHSRLLRYILGIRHFKARTKFLNNVDQVFYSGTTAPCAVHNNPSGQNIHYCHTPPRFIYDLNNFVMAGIPTWQKPFAKQLFSYIQHHYESSVSRMDLTLCNSATVRDRLSKYLNINASVIHPPCNTENYKWISQGDYFLSTARLEPYKRVELLIKAFMKMPDKRLIVTSGGSQFDQLKKMASGHENIKFSGWVQKDVLIKLMGESLASIYIPIEEDFGISPVESMAAGKPVIGVAEGGLKETVLDNETGLLLKSAPSENDVIEAVNQFSTDRALSMRTACEKQAAKFSDEIFKTKILSAIESVS